MEALTPPPARWRRAAARVIRDFRSVIDASVRWPQRLLALAWCFIWCGIAGLALLVAWTIVLIPFTPAISDLRKAKADAPAVVLSADGKELAVLRRMNREWVELDRISPHVVDALIATEDHRFYQHFGVDLRRTAAGILRTLQGDPEGGSTLTQQLARNLYPEEIGRQRTISRKLKELITALKIEMAYSKQEILLTYLNTMPFLYNAFGIEMAARTYFDKPAAKLSVLESATLVGMLKGTSYYNPVLNPERAQKRRNVVLAQMAKRGKLSQAQFSTLSKRPLRLDFERQPEPLGEMPHFTNHLRKWLVEWADRNDYNLYADGLVIHTTIDSRLQAIAQQAATRRLEQLQAVADVEWGMPGQRLLSTSVQGYIGMRRQVQAFGHLWRSRPELVDAFVRESQAYRSAVATGYRPDAALAALKADSGFMRALREEKTRLETGVVALDPSSGEVRAWVGSRNFERDNFDHVARARRQPGSTFKPFVYGAALENGMDATRRFTDREVEIPMGNGSVWRPTDAAAPSGREMSLRDALAYSKNTITAQVMQETGPHRVAAFARKLGIRDSKLDPVPALALGTSPVSLLEMAGAYGAIANGGIYRAPLLVTHISDSNGRELERFAAKGERVMSARIARELTDMLGAVVERGTGRAIRSSYGVRGEVAGKTGTTQNNTDGWFMLMHPQLVAGAWVGFNDARITMRSSHWGQGAQTALPVVGELTRRAQQARLISSRAHFPQPPDSWWDSALQRMAGWLGWGEDAGDVAPAPARKPVRTRDRTPAPTTVPEPSPAPAPASEPVPPYADELERLRRQAWEDEAASDEAAIPEEQTGSVERLPDALAP